MFDGAGDVVIYDARLDDGALIFEVEFEDAIHAGEDEHESAGAGKRATGEAGAGAAAEDGDVVLRGEADNLGDFGGRRGEDDDVGTAFFDGAVVLVEADVFGEGENGGIAEEFLEGAGEVAERILWDGGHDGIRLAQMGGDWGDDVGVH